MAGQAAEEKILPQITADFREAREPLCRGFPAFFSSASIRASGGKILPGVGVWLLLAGASAAVGADVSILPVPEGESPSEDYVVRIEGAAAPVYAAQSVHGGAYAAVSFDFSGGPVTLTITGHHGVEHAAVLPARPALPAQREPDKLTLTISQPGQFSVEPDGVHAPLLIFANAPEQDPPRGPAPDVVYFGPGVHRPGRIDLKSNQTLYLAPGAVVKGAVVAQNADHVRICGRGILDGTDWPWLKGPTAHLLLLDHCRHARVEDVILRGSFSWTLVPRDCDDVTVRNVKILNSRVQNDDAVDVVNSRDVTLENCFIRSDDDCVAVKGLSDVAGQPPVRDLQIRHCVLWCDRARIFLLGHESVTPTMDDIRVSDCDIVHFSMVPFLLEPGEEMLLTRVRFEDIRVQADGQKELLRLRPTVNQYMKRQVPGRIRDVTFRHVDVTGPVPAEGIKVQLSGADAAHAVEDVRFENVRINGRLLDAATPGVEKGACVSGVEFE